MSRWPIPALALFTVAWGANSIAPLLVAYRESLDVSPAAVTALFGLYAVGLIPALLVAGRAVDRIGEYPLVLAGVLGAAVATVSIIGGAWWPTALLVGRWLTGVAAGVVFAAAAAWVKRLSACHGEGTGPRRVTVALSSGFALGPLVAAELATFAPLPLVTSHLPHLALCVVTVVALRGAGRGVSARTHAARRARQTGTVRSAALLATIAPIAPWVFGSATIAFVGLPTLVPGVGMTEIGVVTAVALGTGALIQPLSRRWAPHRVVLTGLFLAVLGLTCGATSVLTDMRALVWLAAIPFGGAYGLCLSGGMRQVDLITTPEQRSEAAAVFLASTYIGFSAPFLLVSATAAVGHGLAFAGAGVFALACAVAVCRVARTITPCARDEGTGTSSRVDVPFHQPHQDDERTAACPRS